jgi:cytochrome c5
LANVLRGLGLEHKDHDKVFFATFGAVLAALGAIFFVCITAARLLIPDLGPDPEALVKLEERIRPVGSAVTDPAALVKVAAKVARAPYTGEEVLAKVCNACHMAGVLGAPKEGDKTAWSARYAAAGGIDGLAASAMKGKNAMPPRGGNPDLSDDEIKAAIGAMLKQSGV